MGWVISIIFTLFFIFLICVSVWMYESIDYYTEPEETDIEKKAKQIKEKYKWLKMKE